MKIDVEAKAKKMFLKKSADNFGNEYYQSEDGTIMVQPLDGAAGSSPRYRVSRNDGVGKVQRVMFYADTKEQVLASLKDPVWNIDATYDDGNAVELSGNDLGIVSVGKDLSGLSFTTGRIRPSEFEAVTKIIVRGEDRDILKDSDWITAEVFFCKDLTRLEDDVNNCYFKDGSCTVAIGYGCSVLASLCHGSERTPEAEKLFIGAAVDFFKRKYGLDPYEYVTSGSFMHEDNVPIADKEEGYLDGRLVNAWEIEEAQKLREERNEDKIAAASTPFEIEIRHGDSGAKFYCVSTDSSYSAGILHVSHEWDFMFDKDGRLHSASELGPDSNPTVYGPSDEKLLVKVTGGLYESAKAAVKEYIINEHKERNMKSNPSSTIADSENESYAHAPDKAHIQATNYVMKKLEAAGIEIVTDKKEFNRILENEKHLQKMDVDYDRVKKLADELRRTREANDESKARINEIKEKEQQDQFEDLLITVRKLDDAGVLPDNVFIGLDKIPELGTDFCSIIKEHGELRLSGTGREVPFNDATADKIQPACYSLDGTLATRFLDSLDEYYTHEISKGNILKTEYEKALASVGNGQGRVFAPKIFSYEGLSFVPVRRYSDGEADFVAGNFSWASAIIHKPANGEGYSHDSFYEAADTNADIFYCVERGCFCGVAAEGIFSMNDKSKEMKERYGKEVEQFRTENAGLLSSTVVFESKKDMALMSEISEVLGKGEVCNRKNPALGNVRVRRGSGINADGILHIAVRRMDEKLLHDGLEFEQACQETAAIIFCAVNNIDKVPAVKETNGRWAVYGNGIKTAINKDEHGYFVVTGFDFNGTGKEAAETIAAVNANYGNTPEFLEIYAQVGAAYASLKNSIPHPTEKSNDGSIKFTTLKSLEMNTAAVINNPADCIPLLNEIAKAETENFGVILIDGAHKVKEVRTISVGTGTRALISAKEVFKEAVRTNSSGVILFHNHPDGPAYPSAEDMESTGVLVKVGDDLGIGIVDHIIINAAGEYYSFLEHGEIEAAEHKKRLMTQGGHTYGFACNGKIYLDPETISSNVAVHEYTHLWDEYTQRTNPKLWQKGMDILSRTHLWTEVKNDPNYADIADDDNLVLSECHARICGKVAQQVLERIAEQDGGITKDKVIDWDKECWSYISTEFAKENGIEELPAKSWQEITDFFSMPMTDLMSGTDITHSHKGVGAGLPPRCRQAAVDAQADIDRQHSLPYTVVSAAAEASTSPDDSAIYHIKARNNDTGEYAVWTCFNAETKSLDHGHYNLSAKDADEIFLKGTLDELLDSNLDDTEAKEMAAANPLLYGNIIRPSEEGSVRRLAAVTNGLLDEDSAGLVVHACNCLDYDVSVAGSSIFVIDPQDAEQPAAKYDLASLIELADGYKELSAVQKKKLEDLHKVISYGEYKTETGRMFLDEVRNCLPEFDGDFHHALRATLKVWTAKDQENKDNISRLDALNGWLRDNASSEDGTMEFLKSGVFGKFSKSSFNVKNYVVRNRFNFNVTALLVDDRSQRFAAVDGQSVLGYDKLVTGKALKEMIKSLKGRGYSEASDVYSQIKSDRLLSTESVRSKRLGAER